MKGVFIVIEGLDGAGISTQASLLAEFLRKKGKKVILTKEPTNSILGGLAKSVLINEWKASPKTLQLIFCADRSNHLDIEIEPALSKGYWVVCDRYMFSSLAYGYASNLNSKWLRYINLRFRLPDLCIFLDVKPDTAMSRSSNQDSSLHLFDQRQKLELVRQSYIKIAREFHLKTVDGNGSIEETAAKTDKLIEKAFFRQ
ncbi:dTMP kinase [Candidatus Parvarchaeota archaeon]|nr:dTMP kinase [Candidatus Parvarchaeota archaeon]